ncbi:PREDICTED: uncharacterized protein LOC106121894, partial [Papilio xuthus]|uniref:Uncharacterized protein LOC106121894 n=1 Tax=Papilio xuthus TaxID=66420 RepID=A0AAJ7EDP7_PAPXU
MAQWSINITVVTEPYLVPTRNNWVGDEDDLAAIAVSNGAAIRKSRKGRGVVAALCGEVMVVGAYFSPNRPLSEFESFLGEMDSVLAWCRPYQIVVAGDLNAKSTVWGCRATDARGELVEEWLASNGLVVLNVGDTNTCVRMQGGSIVDVSFASADLARGVRDWEVLEGVETLSDHRYIRFDVSPLSGGSGPGRVVSETGPRWALKKLDREAAIEASLVAGWNPAPDVTAVESESRWLHEAVTHICDVAMPRVVRPPTRTAVYWCKLRPWAPPLTSSMDPETLDRVLETLFPSMREDFEAPSMVVAPATSNRDADGEVPEVEERELWAAVARLQAKNTAPGPDGIPGRIWVLALRNGVDSRFRDLLSRCLKDHTFPGDWKTGKLVLIGKAGRQADSPSAYRPIVLLGEAGKLFERVIATRLSEHLDRVGPNLADCQYGFRRGRSTIDAIARVRAVAEEEVLTGGVVLAVSLDIANAFNTLPHACIMEALRFHGVPLYLRETIKAYLTDRTVVYPTTTGFGQRRVSCGVPQGSVLGPLLWNVGYDWVLRGPTLGGVSVVCYADDTLVLARGGNYREASVVATAGVAQIVGRIRRLGLTVALEKSEALCFHRPRRAPPPNAHLI